MNWSDFSKYPHQEQRSRLIRKYLDSEEIPRKWAVASTHIKPTTMQIDTILRPWRPDALRRQARFLFAEETPILLRTCYRPGNDETFRSWLIDPLVSKRIPPCAVFDDKNMFDFGADWRRIYDIMPEIAGRMSDQSRRSQDKRSSIFERNSRKISTNKRKAIRAHGRRARFNSSKIWHSAYKELSLRLIIWLRTSRHLVRAVFGSFILIAIAMMSVKLVFTLRKLGYPKSSSTGIRLPNYGRNPRLGRSIELGETWGENCIN